MPTSTKEQCAFAGLLQRYTRGETWDVAAEEAADVRTIHSILLLYAYDFPQARMHEVLWCSPDTVDKCLRAVQENLGDAVTAREVLESGASPVSSTEGEPSAASPSQSVGDNALQALDVLEYWTSRWLDDSQEPGTRSEHEQE